MAARSLKLTLILGLSILSLATLHADAQNLFRTYVSSATGNDTFPCTRAQPCLDVATAISQTRTGGEVYVLDSSEDYGLFGLQFTIGKSISIIGSGGRALVVGQFIISPEAGGQVLLRGLNIIGDGVTVTTAAGITLVIDDCVIQGGANGINFSPQGTATSHLVVRNSIVTKNIAGGVNSNTAGILIQPQSTAQAIVVIENVNVNNNAHGIRAFDNSNVTVRNSVSTENLGAGIRIDQLASPAVPVSVFVEHSQVSHNHSGVVAVGPTAIVRISDVSITDNGAGVNYASGGTVCSFANNSIAGNTATFPPTSCPLS
jgi:hypothetical protein